MSCSKAANTTTCSVTSSSSVSCNTFFALVGNHWRYSRCITKPVSIICRHAGSHMPSDDDLPGNRRNASLNEGFCQRINGIPPISCSKTLLFAYSIPTRNWKIKANTLVNANGVRLSIQGISAPLSLYERLEFDAWVISTLFLYTLIIRFSRSQHIGSHSEFLLV